MNNIDYIRKAVELADEWWKKRDPSEVYMPGCSTFDPLSDISQQTLDALAAQLVRKVDAIDGCEVICDPYCIKVFVAYKKGAKIAKGTEHRFDRTMNTLKSIVDSKILEESKDEG